MKRYIYISAIMIALTAITMVSCEKKVDVNAVSATLPGIQLSSIGMSTPGPYVLPTGTTPNVIQILFGATTTNKTAGAFDVFIYDSSAPTVAVATLHFASWTANDSYNTTSLGSIGYANVPSTYPNTTIFQGSVLLKYGGAKGTGAALVSGKSYNITATASSTDGIKSTISVSKLFTIQ